MSLKIRPYPRQNEFILCPERFTGFVGGIGSGKSWAGAVKGLLQCDRPTLGLVIAPTYPMLRDATWRSYQEVAGAAIREFNKGEFVARIGQAEVLFRSADKPDRLRGPNIHWAHIDEAAMCPAQTWEIVIGRLRASGQAGPCWVTTTPRGRNWLWDKREQIRLFRARTKDNPHISREFVASLEMAYTGQFSRQELGGEFVSFEGLVYEEFTRETHAVTKAGPWRRVIAGIDEGYTNPAVILAIGLDSDDRAHIIEEFYQRRVLQGDVVAAAARMREQYGINEFWADPSAAGLIAEMQANNLPVMPANHAVMPGIQAVKARMAVQGDGMPRLTVDPANVNTISEFESYVWKDGKRGMKDEPEKVNDHAMDALRYAVMSLPRLDGALFV